MGAPRPLALERLESRQLLATIVEGFGVEIGSNLALQGGSYDQILLTGTSVTVAADPGQVVRVAFLDEGGDIVQAEFSGKGTMTVSLENARTLGEVGYVNRNPDQLLNGKPLAYMQGLATLVVDKPELNTNLGVFAAGPLQNPGFFAGQARQGDNGMADIARVLLVGDPGNGAGYSNMGGIRMGGVVFGAGTGVVGIRGENVAVQTTVAIGDIDARGSGVPTLMFNSNSQFQSVFVRGGDLRQSNGASFDSFGAGDGGAPGGSPGSLSNVTLGGFSFFNSSDGTTSKGQKLWATPVDQSAIRLAVVEQQTEMAGDWVFDWSNLGSVKVSRNGVDVSATFGGDWSTNGGLQAGLDRSLERRTFLGSLTFAADLPAGYELNLADARGDVTFMKGLFGVLSVNGFGAGIDGTLTVKGDLDGAIVVRGLDRTAGANGLDGQPNVLTALIVEGSTGPFTDVRAEEIGTLVIRKNFSGIISTDVNRNGSWDGTAKTATGFVDVDGRIGNVTIGYSANGSSTGGSVINATLQGASGIGNVRVGGDVYGSPVGRAVFQALGNPGAAPTDVRAYGSANIGTIDVRGDVDLDRPEMMLVNIANNGSFGNIVVQGLTTTQTIPGVQTGTRVELIPGTEVFVRVLSPFLDTKFAPDPGTGQKLVQNYDPDGAGGPLDDTYLVTQADVDAGAKVYDISAGRLVAAKVGDRIPALNGGVPILDTFGNVLYRQNTALFESKTRTVPVIALDTVSILSGGRGSLDGVFNNFGRIEIGGLLGAQQRTTGSITWTDAVDMNFGGITVGSAGTNNDGVLAVEGLIGQITINNSAGAKSDIVFSGAIGSPHESAAGSNASSAMVGLTGLFVVGFEDVKFSELSADPTKNNIIHATRIKQGISITTIGGSGIGIGKGTISPSILFDSRILLDDGTAEQPQTALVSLNTGMINSSIRFGAGGGIVIDDGGTTGNGSFLGSLVLRSDYVGFQGILQAERVDEIVLVGGKGTASGTNAAISFTGSIVAKSIGNVSVSASSGSVVFEPRLG